ncbi:endonuclease III [Endomicrobiia bacterium]|uniref:Endonuclease III n=3 Tax=Elusimicrobiota TaxID=74152 RepID=B1GYQ7_ENDTX|nr:endonuclease III [Candidatus Endomicrobium trichonymphae]GHT05111.1 endonuclease III [Endomicrobiia bacterium]BAG14150.1 endonuclease III [Candidatus Endomicrobium trichonymphae]GHT08015.1 endonuclease III [Endomicrobiia bacterium]GHT14215.1 endonuclease III [Endomicrobiia bacterium]GHT17605.1 endonuclease III [Endomicrobiia bacterium]
MEKNKKEHVVRIIKILEKDYGHVECALNFSSPFELLAATILSAQCTDERVNKVTKDLFKRYKNVEDYANADILELENYIKSAGFFRNKAKNIIKSAQMVINKYNGDVPQTMKELLELSGVARKTANVVLGSAFGKSEGIAVDTHVIRITNLLKLTEYDDPVKIEKDLMKTIPKKYWMNFSFLIQTLGRIICKARNPGHIVCPLNEICPSSQK